jgi:hypothetical protein
VASHAKPAKRCRATRTGFEKFSRGLNWQIETGVRAPLKAMAAQSNLHGQAAIAELHRARPEDHFRFDPECTCALASSAEFEGLRIAVTAKKEDG